MKSNISDIKSLVGQYVFGFWLQSAHSFCDLVCFFNNEHDDTDTCDAWCVYIGHCCLCLITTSANPPITIYQIYCITI